MDDAFSLDLSELTETTNGRTDSGSSGSAIKIKG